jgi:uncharacterized protein (DUF2141 family)
MITPTNLKRGILSLIGVLAVSQIAPPASAQQSTITVNMSGIRSQKGNVVVCLWSKENKDFPFCSSAAAYKSTTLKANNSNLVATFQNIPSGEYAISAFHDENGNGKLDTNWMGMPKEGLAAPNAPKMDKEKNQNQGRRERPSFDKMKFKLDSSTTVSASFMYR